MERGEPPHDEHGRFASEQEEREATEEKSDRTEETPEDPITAPSIGPKTVLDRQPAEERLAQHEQSQVDAMGLDKHRAVVGQAYGPSLAKQVGLYGAFLAGAVALVIGFITVADRLDEPSEVHRNEANWAQPGAPQVEPAPLDSPRNGSPDAGP